MHVFPETSGWSHLCLQRHDSNAKTQGRSIETQMFSFCIFKDCANLLGDVILSLWILIPDIHVNMIGALFALWLKRVCTLSTFNYPRDLFQIIHHLIAYSHYTFLGETLVANGISVCCDTLHPKDLVATACCSEWQVQPTRPKGCGRIGVFFHWSFARQAKSEKTWVLRAIPGTGFWSASTPTAITASSRTVKGICFAAFLGVMFSAVASEHKKSLSRRP